MKTRMAIGRCCCATTGTVSAPVARGGYYWDDIFWPNGTDFVFAIGREMQNTQKRGEWVGYFRTTGGLLNIPAHATITSATIVPYTVGQTLRMYIPPFDYYAGVNDSPTTDSISSRIVGQDTDNATILGTYADYLSAPRTTANVAWNPVANPVGPTGFRTWNMPDLSPPIQEIIDRPGWSPFNEIQLLFDEDNSTIQTFPGVGGTYGEGRVEVGETGIAWKLEIEWIP